MALAFQCKFWVPDISRVKDVDVIDVLVKDGQQSTTPLDARKATMDVRRRPGIRELKVTSDNRRAKMHQVAGDTKARAAAAAAEHDAALARLRVGLSQAEASV